MSDPTTPDGETPTDTQSDHPVPPGPTDDSGEALDRVEEAIGEARDARASVAAHDDITSGDAEKAGEYSEAPDGQDGAPLT